MNSQTLTTTKLATLSQNINDTWTDAEEQAGKATEFAKSSVCHGLNVGQMLAEAKAELTHGEWEPWIEKNCPFGSRQARKLMRLAREWPQIEESIRTCGSVLGINGALALVSESSPDVPDEQRQDRDQKPNGQSDAPPEDTDAANDTDERGSKIPKHLTPQYRTGKKIKSVGTKIEIFVLSEVLKLTELEGSNFIEMQDVKQKLKALKEAVTGAAYYIECPKCLDEEDPDCDLCEGKEFVPESAKHRLPPEE
jgi:hypothetical protein